MLEPPSEHLWQRLRDGLGCLPVDLRRARRRVKQLARDLPAFDSVWIDAFLQTGRLTPYQARLLESDADAPLRSGPFVLLDDLGRGASSRTWLARRAAGGPKVVLKRLEAPAEARSALWERAQELIGRTVHLRHSCLASPNECFEDGSELMLVSPFVPGLPLNDLLVRRGRFPAAIVAAIARQLIDGLATAHAAGVVHGDVRRSHVRITEAGMAVLVETGLGSLSTVNITVHAPLALEAYDGLAPELIGIGRTTTPASDWYGLGCLLWQLLAGRPPFPMADPLAKLAAHQTRTIDEVRERAPDTPAILAELLTGLTQSDPQRRSIAVQQHREQVGEPTRRDRRAIARFRREFDTDVPHLRSIRPRDSLKWPLALTAGCVGALVAAALADAGLRSQLLSLAAPWTQTASPAPPQQPSFSADLLPLPPPAPDGTMVLDRAGPYAAATIRFPGTLALRAAEGVCPEILIRDQPLRIAAQHWKCENIRLHADRLFRAAHPARTLVELVAERVTWRHCRLDLGEQRKRSGDEADLIGIQWRSIDDRSAPVRTVLRLTGCQFQGMGVAWHLPDATADVSLENVLHQGRGPLLAATASSARTPLNANLRNVTLRDSGPLLRWDVAEPTASPRLAVTADDCVLQPGREQAVLEYAAATQPAWTVDSLVWSGEGSILTPNVPLLAWSNSVSGGREELPTDSIELDGLAIGQVQFKGLPTPNPADSVVVEADAPRRSPEPPGILAGQFGTCLPAPVP